MSFIPRAPFPDITNEISSDTIHPIPPDSRYFTVFSAFTWGIVMWLFKHRPHTIQTGMFNSMTYLYLDSNSWTDPRTLLWHNK